MPEFRLPFTVQHALAGAGVMAVILVLFTLFMRHRRKVRREQERRERFRERHLRRLEEMNMTEESFHEMVEEYKHRKDPGAADGTSGAPEDAEGDGIVLNSDAQNLEGTAEAPAGGAESGQEQAGTDISRGEGGRTDA